MRVAHLQRFDGRHDDIECYDHGEYQYWMIPESYKRVKSRGEGKAKAYMKTFAVFDIETTTITPEGDEPPFGFMYHWQMNIGGVCLYGRRWEEWINIMKQISRYLDLSEEKRMVVYVHNLPYEFQFMRNFLADEFGGYELFATQQRKPISVRCSNGFEFRCSYKLTNMSLYKAVNEEKGTVHPKAIDDLDYKQIRTAETELTDTEFGYCIADVVSLYELIENRLINENDTLESIPLTSTGYVRRDCRLAVRKDKHYRDKVFKKNYMGKRVYDLLIEAGRGGNTHANRYLSGRRIANVLSFDVVSSYPAQMLLRKFPMTKFTEYGDIDNMEEFENLLETKACLFRILISNVKVKDNVTVPYIPTSKLLTYLDCKYDNGRILSAKYLSMTVTDIDFKIIRQQYEYDDLAISDMQIARYDYLPDSLLSQVREYYRQKCELKYKIENEADDAKLDDLKYLYAKSKNRLNGIFGMCYTNPVHPVIELDQATGSWNTTVPDIDEALEKYFKSRNSFLIYSWGVWVTAWARYHLEQLLNATGEGTIYCDTDSSKCIASDAVIKNVQKLNDEITELCEQREGYCIVNGQKFYLGIYENETPEPLIEFKTLGAKKYAYVDKKGLHITISGVEKKTGAAEMEKIENFTPGFIFKKAGGSTLYYNDLPEPTRITVDGCEMLTASNIGMVDSTYELGVTGEYAELIGINIYKEV